MKKIVSISMGLLAILAISCSKKDSPIAKPAASEAPKGETITITVGAPEDIESKVAYAYDEAEKKLKLTWETGDKIVLQQGDQAYPFTATTISENGKMATFTGTSAGEGTYDVFYAGNGETAMPLAEVEAMDYTAQTQSANNNTQHLKFAARLKSVTFTPGTDDIYFTADWAKEHGNGTYQQSGAIRIRLQNPGVTSLKSVTLTAPSAIFPKTNALSETSTSLTVSLPNASIEATDPIVVYAMLPWSQYGVDLPAGDYTVSVTTEDFDVWTKTKAFEANTLSPVAVNSIGLNKTGFALQDFYGGSGIEGDPYLIANARQMGKIDSHLSATKTYYKLIDNIKLSSWTSLNSDGSGIIDLDGNGKTISDLNAPLFDDLNGNIKDLTIYNAVISSDNTVGILANTVNTGASIVSGVTIEGDSNPKVSSLTCTTTAATKYVGCLAGEVSTASKFDDCHINNITITSTTVNDNYVGGAFGYVHHAESTIGITLKCTVSNTVMNVKNFAGGFIGYLDGGSVNNNEVACDVNGRATIGGFIAYMNDGSLTKNTASGSVIGLQTIGGLVGHLENGILIGNSTSGDIEGDNYYVGGLIGYMDNGKIDSCHATGNVTSKNTNYSHTGGLIGLMNDGTVINKCYYSSGTVTVSGKNGGGLIGEILGDGTVSDCFSTGTIKTTAETVGGLIGLLDGSAEYSLSNCYSTMAISGTRYIGGVIGTFKKGAIKSCHHSEGKITSTDPYARSGGLVGNLIDGTIDGCSSFCNIEGTGYYIGGLVGDCTSGTINQCFASGSLKTSSGNTGQLGGLIGIIGNNGNANITNCYSQCSMTAGRRCGGFIGKNEGSATITNSYTEPEFTTNAAGALIGWNTGSATLTKVVFWSNLTVLVGYGTTIPVPDDSYLGQEGTILSQAKALGGWDFTNTWNEVNPPTLKWQTAN